MTCPGPTGCCKIAAFGEASLGFRSTGLGCAGGGCLEEVLPARSDLGKVSRAESALGNRPGVGLNATSTMKYFHLFVFAWWLLCCKYKLIFILLGVGTKEDGKYCFMIHIPALHLMIHHDYRHLMIEGPLCNCVLSV